MTTSVDLPQACRGPVASPALGRAHLAVQAVAIDPSAAFRILHAAAHSMSRGVTGRWVLLLGNTPDGGNQLGRAGHRRRLVDSDQPPRR
jgi:hypothetical protein